MPILRVQLLTNANLICMFVCLVVTHPHQIISHYYTLLEGHMDADSISHMMHCKHLITDEDYDAITSAPNDMKMNCLILQYVKTMDIPMILEFCDLVKSIETQHRVGECLENCKFASCVYECIFLLHC